MTTAGLELLLNIIITSLSSKLNTNYFSNKKLMTTREIITFYPEAIT